MTQSLELLHTLLRESGNSVTTVRDQIFAAIDQAPPKTMRQLQTDLQGSIDRVSLYRTVSLFERLGIVQRIHLGRQYKLELTDTFTHHHHHLSCVECGAVITLTEDEAIEALLHRLADRHGFQPLRHQLEIQGICSGCR